MEDLRLLTARPGDPLAVRAEVRCRSGVPGPGFRVARQRATGARCRTRRASSRAALRVGQLQALDGVGERRRRVAIELALAHRQQLAGLGAERLRLGLPPRDLAPLPEDGRRHGHRRDRRDDRAAIASCLLRRVPSGPRAAAASANASSVADESARVALPPDREVAIRRSRPEQVLGPPAVVPELRRLPQLVPELRAVRVLRLPAHEPRPRR